MSVYTGLLPHQHQELDGIRAALARHNAALDGSDLGIGKTYAAAAAIRSDNVPTLVVAPLVAKTGWQRAAEYLGTSYSISHYEALRLGKTPYGKWEFPFPEGGLNYYWRCNMCQLKLDFRETKMQQCPYHPAGIHCVEKIKPEHNYGKFYWHENIKRLVFDEVHRASALDSLQSDMLTAAKRQRIQVVGLSATVAETPLDFRALGYVLGLHSYTNFYQWAARYGCRRLPPLPGIRFAVGVERQKKIMADIHAEIFPERGVRVRINDLPAGSFPEVQITAELYDLSEPNLLAHLYEQMDSAILSLNLRRGNDLDENPLTTLLRARQESELLKVPVLVELAEDARSSRHSVALFVNFRRTVDELCARLKTKCRVDGSQVGPAGAKRRQACIDAFQSNESWVIVLSQAAGSASLSIQDEHGGHPRLGLVIPGVSAQTTRQLCGRLRRATGKSKSFYRFVLAAGTVEEKIHKALSASLNNMDALNDADLWAANLPLTRCNIKDIFNPNED